MKNGKLQFFSGNFRSFLFTLVQLMCSGLFAQGTAKSRTEIAGGNKEVVGNKKI